MSLNQAKALCRGHDAVGARHVPREEWWEALVAFSFATDVILFRLV